MTEQTMIRLFLTLVLTASVAWSCSGKNLPEAGGLVFQQSFVDLGERWAGEQIPLEFPFSVVGSPVVVSSVLPECSCLSLELWVEGKPYAMGSEIPPGNDGVLKVLYHTAGFRDRKFVGINLKGVGEGLDARVEVRSWLRLWFDLQPEVVNFGLVDGKEERSIQVVVQGQEPFRITEVLTQTPPLEVRGVPSAESRHRHVLEIILPPTTEEGRHAGFFSLATDKQGYTFRLAVGYEVAGDLWTMPDKRLLLGELRSGVEQFSVIEVGARTGQLAEPQVALEGLPGGVVQVEKLATEGRYRVHLRLLPDASKISGVVVLSLPYTVDGHTQVVERRIQVFAVVREP